LTALIDHELPSEEVQALKRHLHGCPACKQEYESLLFAYELTSRLPSPEINPNLWVDIRSHLTSDSPKVRWKGFLNKLLFNRPWVPASAALGTVVVVLFLLVGIPADNPNAKEFSAFVQQREILSKRNQAVLFNSGGFNRYEPRRNPFIRTVQYTGKNPFRGNR
jgi:anti-sigma factor RsiW